MTTHASLTRSSTLDAPTMVRIPGGRFTMGDELGTGSPQERPAHEVEIGEFWIARHCTTARQYHAFIVASDSTFDDYWCDFMNPCFIVRTTEGYELREGAGDYPMVQVSHVGAIAYCNWLSSRRGYAPVYDLETLSADLDRDGFRLPTEAEWERACAGPDGRHGREPPPPDVANGVAFSGPRAGTRASARRVGGFGLLPEAPIPVGTLPANGFGVHEMLGNVNEWCHDRYGAYERAREPARDPCGPDRGSFRVIRGGSFIDPAHKLRATHRHGLHYHAKCMIDGFRIARKA